MPEVWVSTNERWPEYDIELETVVPQLCTRVTLSDTELADFKKAQDHWFSWQNCSCQDGPVEVEINKMTTKIYIAALYSTRDHVRENVAPHLTAAGFEVTSRWLMRTRAGRLGVGRVQSRTWRTCAAPTLCYS